MIEEEIRAQLSSVRKHRNPQEWRTVNTATAEGITISSDGELMRPLAKALIAAGKSPFCALSAWRGDMICLKPFAMHEWASGSAGKGEQPKQLNRRLLK